MEAGMLVFVNEGRVSMAVVLELTGGLTDKAQVRGFRCVRRDLPMSRMTVRRMVRWVEADLISSGREMFTNTRSSC